MDFSGISASFSAAGDRLVALLSNAGSYALANLTLDIVIRLLVLYFFIIWAAFVVWVIKDITNRTSSILLQVFCILLVILLTPIFGLPIYLLVRPSTTLFERYYVEGGDDGDEEADDGSPRCANCGFGLDGEYRYCPRCGSETAYECAGCHRVVRAGVREVVRCPYCGAKRDEAGAAEDGKTAAKNEKKSFAKADKDADGALAAAFAATAVTAATHDAPASEPAATVVAHKKSETVEETVAIDNPMIREVTVSDIEPPASEAEKFARPNESADTDGRPS